ncbi:ChrR-like anti-ECFsigma factor [Idiomarina loihiensis]|uniref:ChrR family anti-sigma-E factor n=1 Tax=Idiomarina TaxID=135575 RepID=UPI000D716A24|nr:MULTISPECIES: ChrR family anti-sigma-E factor [Idiomarina]PWW39275.1 ChrR-like anti-ECFsigma factor [Idiomarina loihiensis]TDP49630.1 ChrR-like anti-ECFsigma factor [Idiomarina loihiensis]TDS24056.1 ChrR-like anti-ECFsigma factor [Idiomarina sp. H2]
MMIKSHPGEGLLYQYASGDLSAAMTLVVGTHIDMCKTCRQTVCEIEQKLCEENLDTLVSVASTTMSKSQCDQMLEAIFASSACNKPTHQPNEMLSLEGRRFTLPRTLAHNSHRIGEWSKLVGKLWRAPLTLDNGNQTNLIYMAPGARLPEHTHKGKEATLVIDGVFNDEQSEYRDGDFILLDPSRTHTPETQDEDCLTLATLDAPLHFTSGISRLLNPFSQLFFR